MECFIPGRGCGRGLRTKLVRAGEVLPELVDGIYQGYTGDQSALLVIFYAGVEGKPTTVIEGHE